MHYTLHIETTEYQDGRYSCQISNEDGELITIRPVYRSEQSAIKAALLGLMDNLPADNQ